MKDDCAEIGGRAVANWRIEGLGIAVVRAVNGVLQMRKFQKLCQALCRGVASDSRPRESCGQSTVGIQLKIKLATIIGCGAGLAFFRQESFARLAMLLL